MARHDDEDYEGLEAKPPYRSRRHQEYRRDYGEEQANYRRTKSNSYGSSSGYPPRYQPEPRRDVGSTLYRRNTDPERRRACDFSGRSYSDYSHRDEDYSSDWGDRSERSSTSVSMRYDGGGGSPSYRRSSTAPTSYGRRGDYDDRSVNSASSQDRYGRNYQSRTYHHDSRTVARILDSSDHSSDSSSTREEARSQYKICSIDQKLAASRYTGQYSGHDSGSVCSQRSYYSSRDSNRAHTLDRGSEHSARSAHSSTREEDRYVYRRTSTDPGRYGRRPVVDDGSVHSVPALKPEPVDSRHEEYRMASSSSRSHEYHANRRECRRAYDRTHYDDYYHRPYVSSSGRDPSHRRSASRDDRGFTDYSGPPDTYRRERRGSSTRKEQTLLPHLAPMEAVNDRAPHRQRTLQIDDSIDSSEVGAPETKSPPKHEVIPDCLEEVLDNRWAVKWNQQQGGAATASKEAYIEILPGIIDQLRRSDETKAAIQSDRVAPTKCWSCSTDLFCLEDLSYIICPKCEVISPAKVSTGGRVEAMSGQQHGVAIGFTYETFAKVQSKLLGGIP